MLIPDRDHDVEYDHPDVVMPWWAILSTFVCSMLLLVLVAPAAAIAALLARPKSHAPLFVDPIEAVRVLDGEGTA